MGHSSVWYRVVDPVNPLCGCDVRIDDAVKDDAVYHEVVALRRVDVLVGDRPFQLRAPDGQGLGVCVAGSHLEESPIQDDVVEIAYDSPYGKCLDELSIPGPDGDQLQIARYERAIQAAYGEQDGELYATCTIRGDRREERLNEIVAAFVDRSKDVDDLKQIMYRENH